MPAGWTKIDKGLWESDNGKYEVEIVTLEESRGPYPGEYRVDLIGPTTDTRYGPITGREEAEDEAYHIMESTRVRNYKLPDIEWAKSSQEENLDWVDIDRLRPNQLEDWYTEEELADKGWIQTRADDPFYPIPVRPNGDWVTGTLTVNDGHHRVSYCYVKNQEDVLVEFPTVFAIKKSGGREMEIYAWKYIDKNHPKIGGLNVDNKREQIREGVESGKLEWAKEDGEILYE